MASIDDYGTTTSTGGNWDYGIICYITTATTQTFKRVFLEPLLAFFAIVAYVLRVAKHVWRPDAHAALSIDKLNRSLRYETLKLTAAGERFKAFIQRRRQHAEAVADGYLPEAIIVGTA